MSSAIAFFECTRKTWAESCTTSNTASPSRNTSRAPVPNARTRSVLAAPSSMRLPSPRTTTARCPAHRAELAIGRGLLGNALLEPRRNRFVRFQPRQRPGNGQQERSSGERPRADTRRRLPPVKTRTRCRSTAHGAARRATDLASPASAPTDDAMRSRCRRAAPGAGVAFQTRRRSSASRARLGSLGEPLARRLRLGWRTLAGEVARDAAPVGFVDHADACRMRIPQ